MFCRYVRELSCTNAVSFLPYTENCNDTTIKFTERLIAGTLVSVEKCNLAQWTLLSASKGWLRQIKRRGCVIYNGCTQELYNCTNVAVHISPQDALPSVVIDKCSNIDLHFHQPTLVSCKL